MEKDELFLAQHNEGVQSKTLQRAVRRYAIKAGVKNDTHHTLRHSFSKTLIEAGVSLEKVATLLGHSSLNATRISTKPGEMIWRMQLEGLRTKARKNSI